MYYNCLLTIHNLQSIEYKALHSVKGKLGWSPLIEHTVRQLNYWVNYSIEEEARTQKSRNLSKDLQVLGRHLYNILFVEDEDKPTIRKAFEDTYQDFIKEKKKDSSLRLRLRLFFDREAEQISTLPWEFLYMPSIPGTRGGSNDFWESGDFLVSKQVDLILTRFVGPSNAIKDLEPHKKDLRILIVTAQPDRWGMIDLSEIEKIQEAFGIEEYDLSLCNNADDLPKEGKRLVIVRKIDYSYHARIFDQTGQKVIDRKFSPENKLCDDLNDALGNSSIDDQLKHKLIHKIISSLGHTLKYSTESTENRIYLRVKHDLTLEELGEEIKNKPPHILHFIGHGKDGKIALIRDKKDDLFDIHQGGKQPHLLENEELKNLFQENKPRLIFLQACQGAASKPERTSVSVESIKSAARVLIGADIPAVVAMQYSIANEDATLFTQTVYEQISKGKDIDEAVREGRIQLGVSRSPRWGHPRFGTPVIYLQSEKAIFEFSSKGSKDDSQLIVCPYAECQVRIYPDLPRCGCPLKQPLPPPKESKPVEPEAVLPRDTPDLTQPSPKAPRREEVKQEDQQSAVDIRTNRPPRL